MKILIISPYITEYTYAKRIFKPQQESVYGNFHYAQKQSGQDTVVLIHPGMGKMRASAATAVFSMHFTPDLVIDSGSCGSLRPEIPTGRKILSYSCYEYDISGRGFPVKKEERMLIHSGFSKKDETGIRGIWKSESNLHIGIQASGEFIIRDNDYRKTLADLFDASACNCETAGVFFPALTLGIPCISLRVVSDLADKNITSDFKKNIILSLSSLYSFILSSIEKNLFEELLAFWDKGSIHLRY